MVKIKIMYTKEKIEKAVKNKGYVWFEDKSNKDYDVNLVSVRNSTSGNRVTNVFDDVITLSYKVDGEWKFHTWACTTDPGTKAVRQFSNSRGVAILVPNQYRSSYTIRKHQGKYDAVCQSFDKPVKVFRDKNKDMKFDMDPKTIHEGIFGINIHRSNPKTESTFVENWSEGCTVFKRVKDFNEFMVIMRKAAAIHGNSFSYTLIESKDII
jgi:hypothetical protein